MDLSNLKPAKGSIKSGQRLGRGQGSTKGGTAGRGHKGQKSRSGYSKKFGFEGGQQPLQTRVPKFGFKNINRIEYKGVNLDTLQILADNKKTNKIDPTLLAENSLVSKKDLVKILGRGEIKSKIEVTAHDFSKAAREAIEKAGGKAIVLPGKHADRKIKNEARAAKRSKAKPAKAKPAKETPSSENEIKEETKKGAENVEMAKDEAKTELKEGAEPSKKTEEDKKDSSKLPDEINGKEKEETIAEEKTTK